MTNRNKACLLPRIVHVCKLKVWGVLGDLHDLDRAIAEAYGWSAVLATEDIVFRSWSMALLLTAQCSAIDKLRRGMYLQLKANTLSMIADRSGAQI